MKYIVGIVLVLIVSAGADGQEREINFLFGSILELISEENADIDEVTELYERLYRNPLDLNRATKAQLEELLVLNDFQIESILSYRSDFGLFFTVYELQFLDGFDKSLAEALSPFLTAGDKGPDEKFTVKRYIKESGSEIKFRTKRVLNKQQGYLPITAAELASKPNSRYLGGPGYYLMQIENSFYDRVTLNFTAESDPGEPLFRSANRYLPDFVSLSAKISGRNFIESVFIGDFSASFGQGLVMRTSFNSISMQSDPLRMKLNDSGFKQYRSAGEHNFLRGMAITLKSGKFRINSALSYRMLDARIENGEVLTIYTTGEHNTVTTMSHKDKLGEFVAILNAGYDSKRLKTTITATTSSYSVGGFAGANLGADFVFMYNGVRYYCEAAIDNNIKSAIIAGAAGTTKRGLSYGFLARIYSPGYSALHASPFSRNSAPENEMGLKFSVIHWKLAGHKVFSSIEYTYFPLPRYRISVPAPQTDFRLEISNEALQNISYTFKVSYRHRYYDLKTSNGGLLAEPHNKLNLKGLFRFALARDYEFTNRVDFSFYKRASTSATTGYVLSSQCDKKIFGERLKISGRVSYFNTKLWDNRIYLSESDITSLSSNLFYGVGIRGWIFVSGKIAPQFSLKLRYANTFYTNRSTTGEGLTLSESPSRHDIRLQLSYRF